MSLLLDSNSFFGGPPATQSGYGTNRLRQHLAGYWKLNDPSFSPRADFTARGQSLGDYYGSIFSFPAKWESGAACIHNASEDLLLCSSPWYCSMDGTFTMAAWINLTASGFAVIFGCGGANGIPQIADDGSNNFLMIPNQPDMPASTIPHSVYNQWAHLGFRVTPTTLDVFLNGSVVDSQPKLDPFSDIDRIYAFNNGNIGDTYSMYGVMGELGFWNIDLTNSQISKLYNNGKGLRIEDFTP